MKDEKYLPIRIIHLLLMLATLVLCIIALIQSPTDTSIYGKNPLTMVSNVLNILALICGMVYIARSYKKNAAMYYKVFMTTLFVAELIQMANIFTLPISYSAFDIIINIIPVICIGILAAAKDLGKKKTIIVASVYVACRIIRLICNIAIIDSLGEDKLSVISLCIENLTVALTAGGATIGKYLDKAERNAK